MRKDVTEKTSGDSKDHPDWAKLLADAVNQPGIISTAYSRFWNYSVGNQILALIECLVRGIEPGPIHTFRGWLHLGRHVRKGERAITLCMPVQVKRKHAATAEVPEPKAGELFQSQVNTTAGSPTSECVTVFTYKARWFTLAQTDGEPYHPQELPEWSESRALRSLSIERVRFAHTNGNCQGYASKRTVAVSPIAVLPHKTLFHELAHVLLGHTEESAVLDDDDITPINLREVEAESVALICCESLSLAGIPECRGYIQNWLGKQNIPDRSAQKIFRAADTILKSGYPKDSVTSVE